MNNVAKFLSTTMKSSIQHSSVYEIVQEPTGQSVEWNKWKVSKCLNTDPEATAIISEKVFRQGYVIGDGRRGRIGDRPLFYVKVEPRVPRFAECLWFSRVKYFVCQLTCNDDSMVLGEDNSINVIVRRVLDFLLDGLDSVVYIVPSIVRNLHDFFRLNKL